MDPFLKQIAETFLSTHKEDMRNYTFIFPNRRSGSFFRKYLIESSDEALILPDISTISDFVSKITNSVEASRIELLFMLYQEYCNIIKDKDNDITDFDQFVYWGDMVLNDFNDVDKYLADAKQLFTNIKDLKDLNTSYLTQEQKDAIFEFFGIRIPDTSTDSFWNTSETNLDSQCKSNFVKLWDILYLLYNKLGDRLDEIGKTYSGRSYRDAVEILKNPTNINSILDKDRYIFIGFNVLSKSEYKIFEILKGLGKGDFYWDYNSPTSYDTLNKAWKFIPGYAKTFPSMETLDEHPIREFPTIDVISVPSNIGQVKYAGALINELVRTEQIKDTQNALNTAIVLPDENLFLATINSIPDSIGNINITMGLPLKATSIASLISSISTMQKRADNKGFFHEDIKNLLAHPYIKNISPSILKNILKYIYENKAFIVPNEYLTQHKELSFLFANLNTSVSIQDIIIYLREIIKEIENNLLNHYNTYRIELGFINQFMAVLNQIEPIANQYHFKMKPNTAFNLIERLILSSTITMEGDPLKGLQVMGVLETRNLDFENLIILSMNEKVFPKKMFSKSFIPNNLRKAFGLATMEHQDSIYAYYFYRLLSRSKTVKLLYDSRTQALSSGEFSRYIYQLKNIYKPKGLNFFAGSFDIKLPQEQELHIEKDERVMSILDKYRTAGSDQYLSASAINKYLKCPLQFYFEKIEKLSPQEEISEFIDSATMGTIIHDVMKDFYEPFIGKGIIEKQQISDRRESKELADIITKHINKTYLKKPENKLTEDIIGEPTLVLEVVKLYVDSILKFDENLTNLEYIQGEKREELEWKIGNNTINFRQFIDRIDKVDGKYRIVDYKTGNIELKYDINKIFSRKKDQQKEVFQLMLYCNAYQKEHQDILSNKEDIKPILYKVREIGPNIKEDDITLKGSRGESPLDSYLNINEEFMRSLEGLIDEIFDQDIPFKQTEDIDNCEYCSFKEFCFR